LPAIRSPIRRAARKLKVNSVAITIGQTIYLHNVSAETFRNDTKWLTHELEHVKQFRRYGFFNFIFRYLWESIRKGYYNNKFEIKLFSEYLHRLHPHAFKNMPLTYKNFGANLWIEKK